MKPFYTRHSCPGCQADVRERTLRCPSCGLYLYWKPQGKKVVVEKRTSSVNWPRNGIVRFRKGTKQVVIRKEADDGSEKIGLLAQEDEVRVIGERGEFYQLDGDGWVHHSNVDIRVPVSTRFVEGTVNASAAGIRSVDAPVWPGSNFVKEVLPGQQVRINEERDGFFRIGDHEWLATVFVDIRR